MRKALQSFWPLLALLLGAEMVYSQSSAREESPLRLSEPVEAIVADLERYVPEYMEQEAIPGIAIALIRNGSVVWTSGFGVTNTLTREPVTADTLFEVASNSKVMTAYVALRLVDQGILSLDRPLNSYLSEPWLPPSEYRDQITLRQVLSHSSGLGHNSLSRESLFPPGRGYSYSGMGYLYLQEVIEEVTQRSLEDLAQDLLFKPLGMDSSSYVNEDERLISRTANGHIWAMVPTLFFVVLFVVALLCVGLLGFPILRLWKGRWKPTRTMTIGAFLVGFVLSLLPPFLLFGWLGLAEFAWAIALCGTGLTATFSLLFLAGRWVISRGLSDRYRARIAGTIVWTVLVLGGLGLLVDNIRNLPVVRWTPVPAGAASSVRATAGDMGLFLVELSRPRFLSEATAGQLQAPQIELGSDLSWGLGPGIQHSRQGDALWQWGQHIDFQSVMVIYPEHGFGAVVLTNSDLLNPDVAINIAHRILGGEIEPIRRGSHTEFDYRESGDPAPAGSPVKTEGGGVGGE